MGFPAFFPSSLDSIFPFRAPDIHIFNYFVLTMRKKCVMCYLPLAFVLTGFVMIDPTDMVQYSEPEKRQKTANGIDNANHSHGELTQANISLTTNPTAAPRQNKFSTPEAEKKYNLARQQALKQKPPRDARLRWPERNITCFAPKQPNSFDDCMKAFCKPLSPEADGRTNMSKHLVRHLDCIKRGLDNIGVPMFVVGGLMIGILTVRGMNSYEMDNDVVVPAWFDFEKLQDYWSSLPVDDACSDFIIFGYERPLRVCEGIRDPLQDCRKKNECANQYRPYSDIFQLQDVPWVDEVYWFDVMNWPDFNFHSEKISYDWKLHLNAFQKQQGKELLENLLKDYADLFNSSIIPFTDEGAMASAVQEESQKFSDWDYVLRPNARNSKRKARRTAFERRLFSPTYLEPFMLDNVNITVLKPRMMEFMCHWKYGFNRWWNYPIEQVDTLYGGYYRTMMKYCNSVYAEEHAAHRKNASIKAHLKF